MKTISLRRFNAKVLELDEPVVVTLRIGGEYRVLGEFYPGSLKRWTHPDIWNESIDKVPMKKDG
jgi:hypothetical protein